MSVEYMADRKVKAAMDRLIWLANSDTGQAMRAANFLLAWWDGEVWGHFPIADLFGVDPDVAENMATIFAWLGQHPGAVYAYAFGEEYRGKMDALVKRWHPESAGT